MSSQGAGKPREQEEKEKQEKEQEEDFYDCQETLEPPGPRGGQEEEEQEAQQEAGGLEDFHITTDRLTHRRDITERQGGQGGLNEEQGDRLKEEEQGDRLQEEQGDRLQEEQGDRLKEEQGDRLQEEQGDRLQEEQGDRLKEQEEKQGDRLKEEQGDRLKEEQGDRLLEEEEEQQGDRLQEDSDSEMKEENSLQVEFDDDYLREVEKELTEEEKEGRRQQSLTLKEKGNSQFKAGDWLDAERSYTEALVLCPVCFSRERAVLFSNRAAARLHLDVKEKAISDCTRATELNPDYVRAWLRRAELHEQTEKLDEALEDYKKVLELDPNQTNARQACMRLPQQIQERNEKLKEEMMSKLKDLGNLVLRPFGLSTNNFQVNQDTDTGSYSINFIQNNNNR
ncbi:tetratricopeptide repeat protein 1 isoform X2 [Sebastes umbrosus]|uniref:tetratricopeptide repeat protein 1 isoform X2 n=1 Tax=Sebastes umbrosus TaxID=72105 RepID=UPI00189E925A|nr:tetratricopeptide repeat protein 1 isoform X2 [Sebastes umbrosus]